jgi:hypothetical protein
VDLPLNNIQLLFEMSNCQTPNNRRAEYFDYNLIKTKAKGAVLEKGIMKNLLQKCEAGNQGTGPGAKKRPVKPRTVADKKLGCPIDNIEGGVSYELAGVIGNQGDS